MTLEKLIFVSGLSIDIVGAYFLAQGFITKKLEALTYEGTSGLGGFPNPRYIISMIAQKSEVWVGFVCLLLGFFIQIVGYFLEGTNFEFLPRVWAGAFIFSLLIIVFALAKSIASLLLGKYQKKMGCLLIKETKQEPCDCDWIINVAKYFFPNLKMGEHEDKGDFVLRVKKECGLT